MENFILYMLKSAFWIAVFWLIYSLFLRREIFFRFNRVFLFAGLGLSFVFALFQFHYVVKIPVYQDFLSSIAVSEAKQAAEMGVKTSFDWMRLLTGIYLLGAISLTAYHLLGLYRIRKIIKQGLVTQAGNGTLHYKIVETQNIPSSFSFFRYVFLESGLSAVEKKLILEHESAHVRQWHHLDIVVAQIVCAFQWFNPFVWFYVSSIKQNQEYIADRIVLEKGYSPAVYHAILINSALKAPVFVLTNSLTNYKFKRIIMMKKNVLKPAKKLAVLLIMPAMAAFMWAFAKPAYSYCVIPSRVMENRVVEDAVPNENTWTLMLTELNKDMVSAVQEFMFATFRKDTFPETQEKVRKIAFIAPKKDTDSTTREEEPYTVCYKLRPDTDKNSDREAVVCSFFYQGSDKGLKEIRVDRYYAKEMNSDEKPYILIDGKELNSVILDNIKKNENIRSVSFMKSREVIEQYGEKGKNGVIFITTKNKR